MTISRSIGAQRVGVAPRGRAPKLRSAAQRVANDPLLLRLQEALARVEDLEVALASSRQATIAAREQADTLTQANARRMALAAQRARDVVRNVAQGARWKVADFGLAAGIGPEAKRHVDRFLGLGCRFRKGEVLYQVGDVFSALYAIRSGSCKTELLTRDGQDQVAGYHIAGEIIGMDGIGTDLHECQATALEDMAVYTLPFDEIENLARLSDRFGRNLHQLLSQETMRAQTLMLVLGTMRAEQRLAVFLLDLLQRYRERGYSSCELVLRMTREEIGSYLGLKLETVSRLFSRFQRDGLIQVHGRSVKLLDRVAVSRLVDGGA